MKVSGMGKAEPRSSPSVSDVFPAFVCLISKWSRFCCLNIRKLLCVTDLGVYVSARGSVPAFPYDAAVPPSVSSSADTS